MICFKDEVEHPEPEPAEDPADVAEHVEVTFGE